MNKEINDEGKEIQLPVSLRDYFAAKAFQACIQSGKINEHEYQKQNGCINWCYVLADKMLQARK